jgi:hypothetical protein
MNCSLSEGYHSFWYQVLSKFRFTSQATPTLTGMATMMIKSPLLAMCFSIALDLWCGHARNIR